jgi:mRNA-degrading endonuclease RelE of RelBE toxin-antitoxin system
VVFLLAVASPLDFDAVKGKREFQRNMKRIEKEPFKLSKSFIVTPLKNLVARIVRHFPIVTSATLKISNNGYRIRVGKVPAMYI